MAGEDDQWLQLVQARQLATQNKPGEMLPKVLETAASLYRSSHSKKLGKLCVELLMEVVDHDAVPKSEKPFLVSLYLQLLWDVSQNDVSHCTFRDIILTFARTYELLFDLIAKTSDVQLWNLMCELKEFILSQWKTTFPLKPSGDILGDHSRSLGVKLATVKFISKVVVVHTNGNSGIGLASVPDNHPIFKSKSALESEAKKLLDYLLNYLSEEPMMVTPLFNGILNCLGFVMKQRPQATSRILAGILRFNIDLKYQQETDSVLNYRMAKRFVERCYKNFVQFGLRSQLIRNSGTTGQYYNKLSKISQTLHTIGEETRAKGILNFDAKQVERKMPSRERSRYVAAAQAQLSSAENQKNGKQEPKILGPPDIQLLNDLQKYTMFKSSTSGFFNTSPVAFDNSYASVYSLMNSKSSEINVSKLSQSSRIKLCTESLFNTDTNKIIAGLSIVASRYTDLMNKTSAGEGGKKRAPDDELQHPNIKKQAPEPEDEDILEDEDKQEFSLGAPSPLTGKEKKEHFERILEHIAKIKDSEEEQALTTLPNASALTKIRLQDWDNKTSWLTLLSRLATRGVSHNPEMSDIVRQSIYDYFVEDFGNRIAVVIEWLSEEWYFEAVMCSAPAADVTSTPIYDKWSLKVLDSIVPFLENSHRRHFIRLVSELPHLSQQHLDRIKSLCLDPLRASLGFQSLKFMLMFRPPVKPFIKVALDAVKEEDESLKEQCESLISKFF
ncbi:LAMI_0F05402g1_1 [Lachancea mirantina]|uniref:LAMI_0F05402g1_1 n=1 Tax=Lachancea mirantina TaxID=1230905 RepID=A0A1G4JYL1_9SACH|nr:LAMI_0F05402g1_1 [Lachancea mirantina]